MHKRFTAFSAVEAMRAAGAEPMENYPESMVKPWTCKCVTCGEIIFPRMVNIARGSKACRHCHGAKPVNPNEAITLMKAAGVEPLEPYPGYSAKWKVRCMRCGRESTPMYSSIAKGQGACFRCGTNYGNEPAHVYLVHDLKRKVVKIGITNIHAHRMKKYQNWETVKFIRVGSGNEAAKIEAEVLKKWRIEMGLSPALSREEMPHKGYSETADEAGLLAAIEILNLYDND